MANRFKWACLELDTWRRLDVYAGQLAPSGHFRAYVSISGGLVSTKIFLEFGPKIRGGGGRKLGVDRARGKAGFRVAE